MTAGERLFLLLIRAYPRAFREQYGPELLRFFREGRAHPRYGFGLLRPLRFWTATLRDLLRVASERMGTNSNVQFAVARYPDRRRFITRWISALYFMSARRCARFVRLRRLPSPPCSF
jgi:hypothetical protein